MNLKFYKTANFATTDKTHTYTLFSLSLSLSLSLSRENDF